MKFLEKWKRLNNFAETPQKKETSNYIEFLKIRKPHKNFAETPLKKEETLQLNSVSKYTEMPQKNGNALTK